MWLGPAIHALTANSKGPVRNKRFTFGSSSCHTVMAGLGPAIHVFAVGIKERRGWPAFAGHDDWEPTETQSKHLFRTGP